MFDYLLPPRRSAHQDPWYHASRSRRLSLCWRHRMVRVRQHKSSNFPVIVKFLYAHVQVRGVTLHTCTAPVPVNIKLPLRLFGSVFRGVIQPAPEYGQPKRSGICGRPQARGRGHRASFIKISGSVGAAEVGAEDSFETEGSPTGPCLPVARSRLTASSRSTPPRVLQFIYAPHKLRQFPPSIGCQHEGRAANNRVF